MSHFSHQAQKQFTPVDGTPGRSHSLERIGKLLDIAAHADVVVPTWHDAVSGLFEQWREKPDTAPTLKDIVQIGITVFDPESKDVDDHAEEVELAGAVAHICNRPQDNPYHNDHHTREVTVMAAALGLREKNFSRLSFPQFLRTLTGACAHDFGHDGAGNGVGDNHTAFKLEHAAIDAVMQELPMDLKAGMFPYRAVNSFTDFSKADFANPKIMSPAKALRVAYAAQAKHAIDAVQAVAGIDFNRIKPGFKLFDFIRSEWAKPALLIAEADLAPSSAFGVDYTMKMTKLVSEENPAIKADFQSAHSFLKFACVGMFISRAAQEMIAPPMDLTVQNFDTFFAVQSAGPHIHNSH